MALKYYVVVPSDSCHISFDDFAISTIDRYGFKTAEHIVSLPVVEDADEESILMVTLHDYDDVVSCRLRSSELQFLEETEDFIKKRFEKARDKFLAEIGHSYK
jgi:hypothetical protein